MVWKNTFLGNRPLNLNRTAELVADVFDGYSVLVLVAAVVLFVVGLFGDVWLSVLAVGVGPLLWAAVKLLAIVAHDIEERHRKR